MDLFQLFSNFCHLRDDAVIINYEYLITNFTKHVYEAYYVHVFETFVYSIYYAVG